MKSMEYMYKTIVLCVMYTTIVLCVAILLSYKNDIKISELEDRIQQVSFNLSSGAEIVNKNFEGIIGNIRKLNDGVNESNLNAESNFTIQGAFINMMLDRGNFISDGKIVRWGMPCNFDNYEKITKAFIYQNKSKDTEIVTVEE